MPGPGAGCGPGKEVDELGDEGKVRCAKQAKRTKAPDRAEALDRLQHGKKDTDRDGFAGFLTPGG